jgi:tetratricopeptide (TPR) repeat protein
MILGKLRGLLILLLAGMCAVAQSPLERAVTLAREKRYAEARQALNGVPEPVDARQRIAFHRLRAAIASGLGETARAAGEMESALQIAPSDAGLLLATAVAESEAGRFDQAVLHAGAVKSAAAQALLGDIQEKRGRYVEAAKAYQAAVAAAPDNEQYRIALALELVQHHTFEAAEVVLQQAAQLFPRSARIRTLLGLAQYGDGRVDEALENLTAAVGLDPNLRPAQQYLIRIALESPGPPPEGVADAVCRQDVVACGAIQLRIARVQGDDALTKTAIANLQKGRPDNSIARCELGRAYQWAEKWAAARTEMEACVRLDGTPQNHYRLGLIYGQLGFADQARKEMELRSRAEERLSEEAGRKANAIQGFEYVVK